MKLALTGSLFMLLRYNASYSNFLIDELCGLPPGPIWQRAGSFLHFIERCKLFLANPPQEFQLEFINSSEKLVPHSTFLMDELCDLPPGPISQRAGRNIELTI